MYAIDGQILNMIPKWIFILHQISIIINTLNRAAVPWWSFKGGKIGLTRGGWFKWCRFSQISSIPSHKRGLVKYEPKTINMIKAKINNMIKAKRNNIALIIYYYK